MITATKWLASRFENSGNYKILLLLLFFFGILSPSDESRAEDTYFTTYSLTVEGCQIDYLVEDLNNDGKNDLLFFHLLKTGDKASRILSIF